MTEFERVQAVSLRTVYAYELQHMMRCAEFDECDMKCSA